MRKALVAGWIVALAMSACGGTTDEAGPTATVASPTPEATPCVLEDASTETQETTSEQPVALLTDVRPSDEGCPSVVFEFSDHVPGYQVRYVEPPIRDCASGEEAPIDGWDADAYLAVRMEPASSADLTTEDAEPTYEGPRDFDVEGGVLKHVRKTCDFEAVMEWVLALDERHAFTVGTFEDPARLVIDVSGS